MTLLRRMFFYTQDSRRWRWFFLPLSYVIVVVPLFAATFAEWGTAIATRCVERCDTGWQNVWSLGWVAQSIARGTIPTHTDMLFYPGGVDLFWQTLMLANGLLMAPVTLMFGAIAAFNTLTYLTFVASAWSAAVLTESITKHRYAAWIAGILYTFAPFHVWLAYSGFVERVSIQYFPLLLLALWHISNSPKRRFVALAIIGVLGSFFSSLYYGLFSITYVAVWTIVLTVYAWRDRTIVQRIWVRVACIAAAVATPVLPFALQILAPGKLPPSSAGGVALADYLERQVDFSASLLTFFTPSLVHPWWGDAVVAWYRGYSATHWPVSIGYCVVVLALYAWLRARHNVPNWWWLMTLVVFVFAMGPRVVWLTHDTGIPLPYDILNQIPLVKLGQRPNHFLFLGLAHLVVVAAVGIRSIAERLQNPVRWALVIPALLALELWPMPLQSFRPTQSVVYDTIRSGVPGAVLTVPFDLDDGNTMYAQWYYQRPVVSGYLPRLNPELVNTGLLNKTDGVVQFTQPITTMTVLNRDPADALAVMMQRLDIPYLVVDSRFGVTTNPAVLRRLTPVVSDDALALYQQLDTTQSGVWPVLNAGWFPIEAAADGHAWQWSERDASFWLYQRPKTRRDLIIDARFSVPIPMTVTLDGVDMQTAVSFAVTQPAHIRRYRVLVPSRRATSEYWWHIDALHQTADRAVGLALAGLSAEQTSLSSR
ncbi:MAG: hypothetical protein RLY87_2625 [Chloroflexota bacterium]|jgi:hypothetical protein